MIQVKGLTQSYSSKNNVLEDIHLEVNQNELCALVGRNGAGKSTLIHSILGLLPIKKGSILLGGISNKKNSWKRKVAYLPEKFQLYPQLTGSENMHFFANLGTDKIAENRINDILKQVNLWEARTKQVKGYSKGMLQRLGLAIMLYYDTEILILDEPTSGLDPMGREEILHILKTLENKTILLSSHHMDEIRQIASHIAYLDAGKITKYTVAEFSKTVSLGGK
ncbi:ABC transporter ATP-binding protein [Alkalihalobacillus sp. BA299]|uniref:ABC transporter ATP-binding protein n=1 Tax=Alkalihalobacillus sp. BA299 TaxID=2815938 RepID=UPI001ADA8D8E|nr:ABC transporter ATP-binding protein [Alkalihalobacillus sp. BA299]